MKIQCSCGTKYSFEITPEMTQAPIRFVCQTCGLDSSEVVNELIRRELASEKTAAPLPPHPTGPVSTEPPRPAGPACVRIQAGKATPAAPVDTTALQFCLKHPGQVTTHRCVVCQKPMCPKCMELFGYVCSPLCNAKAETQDIEIPVYGGKKSAMEARQWRNVGLVAGTIALVVGGLLGFWIWYAWFGSVPKPVFSLRFKDPAYSGQSALCEQNQIVFLHGGTLARHDIKKRKEIWSRQLIDQEQITRELARVTTTSPAEAQPEGSPKKGPTQEEIESVERLEAAALRLHVHGQNIWVAAADKLVRYDWDSGKPLQEIPLVFGPSGLISRPDELLLLGMGEPGQHIIIHISLANGESRVEKIGEPSRSPLASGNAKLRPGAGPAGSRRQPLAGLPVGMPGANAGKPFDPANVAEQAQNLSLPAKIALPAVLANAMNQERILTEVDDGPNAWPTTTLDAEVGLPNRLLFIPGKHGYFQFGVRLLERRFVTRKAMKEPPAKSVLDGNLTVTQTAEVANEILNEMQRSHGGESVIEDQSRYQVTVRRPDLKEASEWTREVVGPPSFFPLTTVSVVAAGKTLVVLDQANKKLWETTLTYTVAGDASRFEAPLSPFGEGPCVERGDTLYVIDEAVLTAFELNTGNVRWRIPSLGTVGVFFDDTGMMYVNTTTASPDTIRYSRQIDVTRKTSDVVLKLDPATGKILWSVEPGAFVSFVSGKFVYTLHWHQADESEANSPYRTGLEMPSHVMIQRLSPADGRVMWEHYERRAPLDVRFAGTSIQIVFKKEVEVLRFHSF